MTEVPYADRRLSFGATADEYDRHRPTYSEKAVRWLLAGSGGHASDAPRVVDVGAGTGALTRALVAAGADVHAVEPDDDMRGVLAASLPGAPVSAGTAEALPVADGWADLVVAGQAWHWFDHAAAAAEFARVLRPGGAVGLVWNLYDDAVPWVAAYSDIVGGDGGLRASHRTEPDTPALGERFGPVERRDFDNPLPHDVDSLVALTATFSYVRLRPDAAAVLAAVRELATTHPDLAGRASFPLPYRTVGYRATRT